MKNRDAEFLEFCRGKPANEEYDDGNPNVCALAQFGLPGMLAAHCGKQGISTDAYYCAVYVGQAEPPSGWRTFGSLVSRLSSRILPQYTGE